MRKESLEDPNFKQLFRMTRLETDGNLYQFLIFRDQNGVRSNEDVSFVMYPDNNKEEREKTLVGLSSKIVRIVRAKAKKPKIELSDDVSARNSMLSSSARNSVTELLL